jgi:phytoene desaturase
LGKKVIIAGSGLGGLSAALRLASRGYDVTILEKYHRAGGRLNLVEQDGFGFDAGPTFMSMSYELKELFDDCNIELPLKLIELDPLYKVFFKHRKEPFTIYRNLEKLEREFSSVEPGLKEKAERYLKRGADFFHDTEEKVIKSNFNSLPAYLARLTTVPMKHLPFMFRSMWSFADSIFKSEEAKIIFTLVAFFLGSTPFKTPAIYSMLSYTELKHDGYWKFEGGMYNLITILLSLLKERGVTIEYNTEVTGVETNNSKVSALIDSSGNRRTADIYIINADAAAFRGEILKRKKFRPKKLDSMKWTMAPFTMYLGLDTKLDALLHHN